MEKLNKDKHNKNTNTQNTDDDIATPLTSPTHDSRLTFETDPVRLHDSIARQHVEIMTQLISHRLDGLVVDLMDNCALGSDDGNVSLLSDEGLDVTVIEVHEEVNEKSSTNPVLVRQDGEEMISPLAIKPSAEIPLAVSSATGEVATGEIASVKSGRPRTKSKAQKLRSRYRKSCTTIRRYMVRDSASLSHKEAQILRKCRACVKAYEKSHPDLTPLSGDLNRCPSTTGESGAPTTGTSEKETPAAQVQGSKVSKPEARTTYAAVVTSRAQGTTAGKSDSLTTRGDKGKSIREGAKAHPSLEMDGPSTSKAAGGTTGTKSTTNNPTRGGVAKRARSGEDPLLGSKKAKKQASLGSNPDLGVAVIDRSDRDGKISPANWLLLEEKVMIGMLGLIDDSQGRIEVRFSGIGWLKGVKTIDCESKEAVEFLKRTVNDLGEVWPGAKLEVISQSSLPLRPVASVWIPPPVLSTDKTLRLLAAQNDGINTLTWEVLSTSASVKSAGLDMRVAIDEKTLEILRVNEGKLRLGLGTIRFRHPSIFERR